MKKYAFNGLRMQNLRMDLNLSQLQLAKKVKVEKNTISNYECNVSAPPCDKLKKLCLELETTADYLLGLSEEPHPDISYVRSIPDEYKELRASETKILSNYNLLNSTIQELADIISMTIIYLDKEKKFKGH